MAEAHTDRSDSHRALFARFIELLVSKLETTCFMGQKLGCFGVDRPLVPLSGCNFQGHLLSWKLCDCAQRSSDLRCHGGDVTMRNNAASFEASVTELLFD